MDWKITQPIMPGRTDVMVTRYPAGSARKRGEALIRNSQALAALGNATAKAAMTLRELGIILKTLERRPK